MARNAAANARGGFDRRARLVLPPGRSRGEIDAPLLNLAAGTPRDAGVPGEGALQASERETIRKVLVEVGGNRKRAAQVLGISLRTLQYRIREYRL